MLAIPRSARTLLAVTLLSPVLAPAAYAVTPISASASDSSCTPATRTGVYRLTLTRDRTEPVFALLVLERSGACQSALLITENAQTALSGMSVQDSGLTGSLPTVEGVATLQLRFDAEAVSGQVQLGRKSWDVVGQRTT